MHMINITELFATVLNTESVDLSITADNQILEVYFDGKRVPVAAGEWTQVRKVAMPTRTRTIAVKCLDQGVSGWMTFAGLLVFFPKVN